MTEEIQAGRRMKEVGWFRFFVNVVMSMVSLGRVAFGHSVEGHSRYFKSVFLVHGTPLFARRGIGKVDQMIEILSLKLKRGEPM
jgi:hypothetical protein